MSIEGKEKFIVQNFRSWKDKNYFALQQERDDLRKRFVATGDYYHTDFIITGREILRHRKISNHRC